MDGHRVGRAFRAVRVRQGWRQADVAARARVDPSAVSRAERGLFDRLSIDRLERIAHALDIQLSVVARWRGGELDRLVNARHSAMHEALARFLLGFPEWIARPEVSFSIYGERGVIDLLAWHAATRSLLVVELKTELIDLQDLVSVLDRKRRLAPIAARELGWISASVSTWVAVASHRTNRRSIAGHRAFLASAFPNDGREMRRWLQNPTGSVAALSSWRVEALGSRQGGPSRVRGKKASPNMANSGSRAR
ncbi:MAG TPA: helix-turn-helix domain-containing protein [Candidatus Limnocylindrales bacterium]|jgi:transcriptional regulator with XRE-family HTH domain